jgi:hypothetical protein
LVTAAYKPGRVLDVVPTVERDTGSRATTGVLADAYMGEPGHYQKYESVL